ncbi:TIGR03016 family PEP-CTERM system-associated outer membrane protein [Alkalimonas collagenimarina]|uniref:TIGR03016 family PEP-CTERM system-associated outer membrane protein n=1 Tax=Alkalimonas collagenimarina TaxID=400390 RepID=A0ABT9GZA1_9GAMM|nr:TIGR03016 family PEP-CTERM system-associated outer membrane protein [Alkalimonas collagenimarina]MDP4536388.1 TIGR03016 family PEP-CTERM system-associated outer membrane protein [Alkalimonas collagenimarina]
MAITTVAPINTRRRFIRRSVLTASIIQALWASSLAMAQGQTFTPAIEVTSHAYQLKGPQFDGTDKGAALDVVPSLAWRYQGPRLNTRFDVNHQRVWYKDSQRSPFSLNEYTFNNQLTGFDRRVIWTMDASRSHIVRGGGQGSAVFRDKITNIEGLSRTERYGTNLLLSNARHREAQYSLNLSARKIESKRPEQDDLLGDIDNEELRASFNTSRAHQYGGVYWRGAANSARTEREGRDKLIRDNAQLQIGFPLFARLALITKGNYENNSIQNSSFTNEFSSAGAGVEWHFGQASRFNVTYNTVLSDSEQSNFVAADFLLAPSRRTSLSGSWDKRYFGRTAQLSGQYNLRFLSMRLSYVDQINTRSFLEAELVDLGLFVCPDGSSDIGDCVTLPGSDYQLSPGEQVQQFFDIETGIREDVILNRQGSFALGYQRNRLTSSLQLSSSELRYVETDRVDRRHTASLENSVRLTPVSRVRMNIRAFDYTFGNTGREDRSWLYELGWSRELSSFSELSITARHSRRNSSNADFEYRENRLSIGYQYRF